tara:strand:- start:839 stop:2101 length:1263 start_codon:yes stop_codon:yes gene_type:complete
MSKIMTRALSNKHRLARKHSLLATLLLSLIGSSATFASGDHHHADAPHLNTSKAYFSGNSAAIDDNTKHSHDDHGHGNEDDHDDHGHGNEDDHDDHGHGNKDDHDDHDDHGHGNEDGHDDNAHDDHGHGDEDDHDDHGHGDEDGHDDHADETKTTIDPHQLALAGVTTSTAGPQTLQQTEKLFGVIAAIDAQTYRLNAPYPSLVEKIHVNVGDRVEKGQVLATLRNVATLQSYSLKSPNAGEVTHRPINAGERVDMTPLLTVTDLSTVWVEMSAFPEAIEKLQVGQNVQVNDLHKHDSATAPLTYIAPKMTGGHIARARAVINNNDGHWRPGMHVKTAVTTATRQVPLAVSSMALQNFREQPVVFSRQGNTFEARPLQLGERDDQYIEVLSGLEVGTEYVTENSFLIKADILKSGAAHVH